MKITKVTYQAAYITGPYLQHRIGFEADIDGGNDEDEIKALAKLKELADQFDKQVNNFEERMVSPEQVPLIDTQESTKIDDDFKFAKERIEEFEYQEEAWDYLNNPLNETTHQFKLNSDLKKLINSKPKRPTNE